MLFNVLCVAVVGLHALDIAWSNGFNQIHAKVR